MSQCFGCKHLGEVSRSCDICFKGSNYDEKIVTNADKIRAMDDKELFYLIYHTCVCSNCIYSDCGDESIKHNSSDCEEGIMKWLQKEVEE